MANLSEHAKEDTAKRDAAILTNIRKNVAAQKRLADELETLIVIAAKRESLTFAEIGLAAGYSATTAGDLVGRRARRAGIDRRGGVRSKGEPA